MTSKYIDYKMALESAKDGVELAVWMLRAEADLQNLSGEEVERLQQVADEMERRFAR